MHYLEEATIEALSTDPSVAGSRVAIGEQRHDDKQNPAMHLVSAPPTTATSPTMTDRAASTICSARHDRQRGRYCSVGIRTPLSRRGREGASYLVDGCIGDACFIGLLVGAGRVWILWQSDYITSL